MFAENPTEQTTAITDVILAAQAIAAIAVSRRGVPRKPMWTDIWCWVFGCLSVASFLGAASHGLKMADWYRAAIWIPAYLALGLTMALFVVAAVSMHWDHSLARRCLPLAVLSAGLFFAVTQFWSDSFLLFVIFESVAMFFSLALYAVCFWKRREAGSGWLAAGVLVGIVAALADTQKWLRMTMVWEFDNHGVFHLIQMVSLLLLTIGIHQSHSTTAEPVVEGA